VSGSIALYHPSAGVRPKTNMFGKDVANVGLFRAVLRHGDFSRVDFMTSARISARDLAVGLTGDEALAGKVTTTHLLDQERPAEAGALVRGTPELTDMAWLRRSSGLEQRYSLVGMIHTLAPPALRELTGKAAIAPIQPWDALICTSPVVQERLTAMFDEWTDYLADRYGGTVRVLPHLPLLPLGVEADRFAALADRPDVRMSMRETLGAAPEDVIILWVGRLSFFEKAFPQPMLIAAEEAAQATGARVHFAQVGWFPDPATQRALYEEAARAHAPSIVTHYLDGNDADLVGRMWAASDIFISLVDNIQETFGITPLEAMAAGLPVVVSDWDGYRFTVRDGIDGFTVRSLGGPIGAGHGLINRHVHLGMGYQTYVGSVAQHTAIHVGDAAARLAELIASPELRARMGQAGRRRVREIFDWPVIVAGLQDLLGELAAIRGSAQSQPIKHRTNPLKGEPFGDFAPFATQVLGYETRLSLRPGVTRADLDRTVGVRLDEFADGWRAGVEPCAGLIEQLAVGGEMTLRELLAPHPRNHHQSLGMGVVWMGKLGLLDWR
jgi:D-inositol-3-phosphate glycosyltransferase